MSGETVDSAKLVTALLVANAALAAEVTNVVPTDEGVLTLVDIYGPPGLPSDFNEARKAVMFLGGGGASEEKSIIARESFDFYCYGQDSAEARSVYGKLFAALNRKSHARITIDGQVYQFQHSQKLSGPADRTDPAEGWDLVYCSFLIHFIEVVL